MGINVAWTLLPIGPDRGVPALPQMVVDLGDAARACFAPLTLVGLEGAGGGLSGRCSSFCQGISFADPLVDLCRRRPAHLVGDMGVDVQRSAAGHVADDSGECLDVHAVFQGGRYECVTKVVEADIFALRPLQNGLQPLSDSGGIPRGVVFKRGGEHPFGVSDFPIFPENGQDRSREDHASVARLGFGRGDYQFSPDAVDLPLHPELPSAEVQIIPLQGADLAPA